MLQNYNIIKKSLLLIFISFFLYSCSSTKKSEDEIDTGKKEKWETSVDARVKQNVKDKGGLLFGKKDTEQGGVFKFANSNIMWKATLKTLEEIPLAVVDYAGGIIITDWYGESSNQNDFQQIKIMVKFLSDEVKVSSIQVMSHKKICENNNCKTIKNNESFNTKIKEKIVANITKISVEKLKNN